MYKILSAVSKRRSGRNVSPVITLGDGNDRRSTNRVAPLIHCIENATEFKTELWRQVYLPPQYIPCIQQRHVIMIMGASRKSNLIFVKVSSREDFYELQVCCSCNVQ